MTDYRGEIEKRYKETDISCSTISKNESVLLSIAIKVFESKLSTKDQEIERLKGLLGKALEYVEVADWSNGKLSLKQYYSLIEEIQKQLNHE